MNLPLRPILLFSATVLILAIKPMTSFAAIYKPGDFVIQTGGRSIEVVATGLNFPEGPSLSPDGHYLYCVNVRDADITRIDLKSGVIKKNWVVLPAPGRGNGSTIGPDGALYIADVGRKLIARIDRETGAISTVVDHDDLGNPLKGPNDLVFDKEGDLYFTDPEGSWGSPTGAAYVWHHTDKSVVMIRKDFSYPNGILVREKPKQVLIAESTDYTIDCLSSDSPTYHVGLPFTKWLFAQLVDGYGGDGMRFDKAGNVYVALIGEGAIGKFDTNGTLMTKYPVGVGLKPTNLCFTPDYKSLYVTESDSNMLVKIKL